MRNGRSLSGLIFAVDPLFQLAHVVALLLDDNCVLGLDGLKRDHIIDTDTFGCGRLRLGASPPKPHARGFLPGTGFRGLAPKACP